MATKNKYDPLHYFPEKSKKIKPLIDTIFELCETRGFTVWELETLIGCVSRDMRMRLDEINSETVFVNHPSENQQEI